MKVYLHNLREVSVAVRHLNNVTPQISRPIVLQFRMTALLAGKTALVKDFLGAFPIPFFYSEEKEGRRICGLGMVGIFLSSAYLSVLRSWTESEECPLCKKAHRNIKKVLKSMGEVLSSGKERPLLSGRVEENLFPIHIGCMFCENFINLLILLWAKNYLKDLTPCESSSCIFSKSSPRGTLCKSLNRVERVRELYDLFLKCIAGEIDPPEFIDMSEVLKELIEDGFVCKEHTEALKKKLTIESSKNPDVFFV